jgi:hypothetical protein
MRSSLIKKPSAWIPIVLSLVMLTVIDLYLANILHTNPTGDEGLGAHLFQIWLPLEVIMIIFFSVKWLKASKQALLILVIAVCAPVFYFRW